MAKYSDGSVVIDAVQFLQKDNLEEVEEFFGLFGVELDKSLLDMNSSSGIYLYETEESVFRGGYIVRDVQGNFRAYERDEFEATYEKVE